MMATISRRSFLLTASGTGVCLLLSNACSKNDANAPAMMLGGNFQDLASVKLIGREYLKLTPEENNLDRLIELLGPARNWESLRQTVRNDFRHDRLVNLQGWPISVTAARTYAVVALAESGLDTTK